MYSDPLGTPRLVTDASNNVIWSQTPLEEPFSVQPPQTIAGSNFTLNLRFPGQYYDQETGLFYNGYRDYDPAGGRYIESDPLGLGAGQFSTYAYVNGNPIQAIDPLGLDDWWNDSSLRGTHWRTKPLYTQAMSRWLDDNAGTKSQHKCAKYVRQGLEAGGADTTGHPIAAADYAKTLQNIGYVPITGNQPNVAQQGDITVIDRSGSSQYGYITEWDGSQWVSDFLQKHQSPYKNPNIPMQVYRHPVVNQDCGCQ